MNKKVNRYSLQQKICIACGWINSGYEKQIQHLWTLTDNQLQALWDCLQVEEVTA